MIFYIRYQWCLQKATWLEIDIAVSTSVCGIRNSSALQSSVDLVHFRSTSGLVPFRKIQTITQMIWSIQSIAAIWLRQGAIINKDAIIAMIKACAYAWSHIVGNNKDNPQALANICVNVIRDGSRREKTCIRGLRTTKAQTRLRSRTVWSAPLLFACRKVSCIDLLQANFQYSS